jgi:hypothetical protein
MIFRHPEFLFDLRPHTCVEERANGLSRVPFGSLISSSCAQSPAPGPSAKPAHTAVRALKGGASLPRWLVLSQHIVHRRQGCKLGIRRKAKSSALRPLHAEAALAYEKTLLPQAFKSCPRTPTNRIPFPTPHTHETLAACSPASSLPLAECCLSPETTMAR